MQYEPGTGSSRQTSYVFNRRRRITERKADLEVGQVLEKKWGMLRVFSRVCLDSLTGAGSGKVSIPGNIQPEAHPSRELNSTYSVIQGSLSPRAGLKRYLRFVFTLPRSIVRLLFCTCGRRVLYSNEITYII